jgi:hypothetical protein
MTRKRITLFFLSIVTLLALTSAKSTAHDLRPGPTSPATGPSTPTT